MNDSLADARKTPGTRQLRIDVPATCANLGPGFDVLGIALTLHNSFFVGEAESTTIEIQGYSEDLPLTETNLFCSAFQHLYFQAGQDAPSLQIRMNLRVPPGKGLGSSATAVVGGLVAANQWLGLPFSNDDLLKEAVKLEHGGHADNVAPALLGGLTVNMLDKDGVISLKLPFPAELRAVVFTPDFPMDTVQGRALMPDSYSKQDAIFNTSRVALFLAALQQERFDLLAVAMQDRFHQPYRSRIFPHLPNLIEAALLAGAKGACLSGGGSSVLAFVTGGAEQVAAAFCSSAEYVGMKGTARMLAIDPAGARAEWLAPATQ